MSQQSVLLLVSLSLPASRQSASLLVLLLVLEQSASMLGSTLVAQWAACATAGCCCHSRACQSLLVSLLATRVSLLVSLSVT